MLDQKYLYRSSAVRGAGEFIRTSAVPIGQSWKIMSLILRIWSLISGRKDMVF